MLTARAPRIACVYCGRDITTVQGRYVRHATPDGAPCPMERFRHPITDTGPDGHEKRVTTVMDLAARMRDEDPALVWAYLTGTPAAEVQRLLCIALCAIPDDIEPRAGLLGWVWDLDNERQTA